MMPALLPRAQLLSLDFLSLRDRVCPNPLTFYKIIALLPITSRDQLLPIGLADEKL
jgi:hypothetical protein